MAVISEPALRSRLTVPWPRGRTQQALAVAERSLASVSLVLVGVIHLSLAPYYLQVTAYVGVLFLLSVAGAWIAALGILAGFKGAWLLGTALSAGMAAGLVLASTVGLPQFRDSLAAPLAVQALMLEGLVIAMYGVVAARHHNVLGG